MSYTQGQTQTVFVGNDNLLKLTGLKKMAATVYDNEAVVTAVVTTRAGVNVTGQNMPVTLTYVEDSDGDYVGILYKEIEWELNEPYLAHVTAFSDGLTALWTIRLTARTRPFTI
jgi:hypothetical protein